MATPIIMPRQGQSVESCILTEWKVKVGDEVSEGDVLAVIETDKASFDLESTASGTILELFGKRTTACPFWPMSRPLAKKAKTPASFAQRTRFLCRRIRCNSVTGPGPRFAGRGSACGRIDCSFGKFVTCIREFGGQSKGPQIGV